MAESDAVHDSLQKKRDDTLKKSQELFDAEVHELSIEGTQVEDVLQMHWDSLLCEQEDAVQEACASQNDPL